MSFDELLRDGFGPLGFVTVLCILAVAGWPWLRRARPRLRRRVVRVTLVVAVLSGLAATWVMPRAGPFGHTALGRHGWLLLTSASAQAIPAAGGPGRLSGSAALTSLIESGVMVAVAVSADAVIRRRFALADLAQCGRCGYDLSWIDAGHCPECGTERPAGSAPPRQSGSVADTGEDVEPGSDIDAGSTTDAGSDPDPDPDPDAGSATVTAPDRKADQPRSDCGLSP